MRPRRKQPRPPLYRYEGVEREARVFGDCPVAVLRHEARPSLVERCDLQALNAWLSRETDRNQRVQLRIARQNLEAA